MSKIKRLIKGQVLGKKNTDYSDRLYKLHTSLLIYKVWCSVVWCGVVWCGVVWCGVVWCGVVWYYVVW